MQTLVQRKHCRSAEALHIAKRDPPSQVVEKEADLLPLAKKLAASITKRNPGTLRLVKEMQHKGQAYDVSGALKYELDIAAKAYEEMGRNSSQTHASLSGAFAARSKM